MNITTLIKRHGFARAMQIVAISYELQDLLKGVKNYGKQKDLSGEPKS
jgi:hypothetical protein